VPCARLSGAFPGTYPRTPRESGPYERIAAALMRHEALGPMFWGFGPRQYLVRAVFRAPKTGRKVGLLSARPRGGNPPHLNTKTPNRSYNATKPQSAGRRP